MSEMIINPEFEGCNIETDESILAKLLEIESQLATREKLSENNGSIREQLILLVKSEKLPEDELVSDWLDYYTTYMFWQRRKCESVKDDSSSKT